MMENQQAQNRSQYDTTFKDLFEQPPQQLLQILIGQPAVEQLPVEFASTQKRLPDLIFLLTDGSIFHLELQSQPEEMNWRMLIYYALIRQRYPNQLLVQKVLYVGQAIWHPQATLEEKNLFFHYEVIDIRTIDCQILMASPTLEENILAILCQIDHQQATIREILYRISELPTKARADALMKLLILSRLRKLETLVKMEAQEMSLTFNVMENDVLRPMFLKAQMDGKQEGRQEGRQEEASSMLLKLIQRKFGQTPEWVAAKVTSARLEQIETWSDNFVFANSIDDVFTS